MSSPVHPTQGGRHCFFISWCSEAPPPFGSAARQRSILESSPSFPFFFLAGLESHSWSATWGGLAVGVGPRGVAGEVQCRRSHPGPNLFRRIVFGVTHTPQSELYKSRGAGMKHHSWSALMPRASAHPRGGAFSDPRGGGVFLLAKFPCTQIY